MRPRCVRKPCRRACVTFDDTPTHVAHPRGPPTWPTHVARSIHAATSWCPAAQRPRRGAKRGADWRVVDVTRFLAHRRRRGAGSKRSVPSSRSTLARAARRLSVRSATPISHATSSRRRHLAPARRLTVAALGPRRDREVVTIRGHLVHRAAWTLVRGAPVLVIEDHDGADTVRSPISCGPSRTSPGQNPRVSASARRDSGVAAEAPTRSLLDPRRARALAYSTHDLDLSPGTPSCVRWALIVDAAVHLARWRPSSKESDGDHAPVAHLLSLAR